MSGHKYSDSVKGLFSFLHTLHEGFWSHSASMHGFGVSDSLPILIDLFDTTLIQYGAQIVESAGLDVLPQVFPTKDVKLKQAKEAPDTKDKAKAFMKGLFKKDKEKEGKEEEDVPTTPDLVQKGIVVQTIQSLCVRLCCIEAAIVSHTTRNYARAPDLHRHHFSC
jgi:hypothetical protein